MGRKSDLEQGQLSSSTTCRTCTVLVISFLLIVLMVAICYVGRLTLEDMTFSVFR